MNNPIPYRPGMTLMPGQSTVVSIPIPDEIATHMHGGSFSFQEVPPPTKVPVQEAAKAAGLLDGLRLDDSCGSYRCAHCNHYDTSGKLVWVPDSVEFADSTADVIEQCRRSAYNGRGSGWCLSCAKKLGKNFFQRLFSF